MRRSGRKRVASDEYAIGRGRGTVLAVLARNSRAVNGPVALARGPGRENLRSVLPPGRGCNRHSVARRFPVR